MGKRKGGYSSRHNSVGLFGNAARAAGAIYNMYRSKKRKVVGKALGQTASGRMRKSVRARTLVRRKKHIKDTVEAVHGEIKRKFHKLVVYKHINNKSLTRDGWNLVQTYNVPLSTVKSAEGTQNPAWLMAFASADMIINSTGAPDLRYQMSNSLFDTNPAQSSIGGTLFGSQIAPADDRIKLMRVKVTFEFSNQSSGPAMVDVYWLKQKVNGNVDPVTAWGNVYTSRAFGKGVPSFPTSTAVGTAGQNRSIIPGTRPELLPEFRKMFRILKHNVYELAPNANVNETVYMHHNKLLDKKYITDIEGSGNNYLGGTTVHLMLIQRGAVGVDTLTGANKPGNTACILESQLAGVITAEYECKAVKQNRFKAEHVNPIQFYTGSGLTNEKIINVVDTLASEILNN